MAYERTETVVLDVAVERAAWLGFLSAGLGVLVGVVMALQSREVTCADGTFFPAGETDFRCFSHPQALAGTSVIALSLVAAAIVWLLLHIVRQQARALPPLDARRRAE